MKKNQIIETSKAVFGKACTSLKMGIIGLPNAGKRSTFDLFHKIQSKVKDNPYSIVDKNNLKVPVTDECLDRLVEIWEPEKRIPAFLNVSDIAGIMAEADQEEGLGTAFLNQIQAVDGLFHVVRLFNDNESNKEIDPIGDIQTINDELLMKDMMSVEKKLDDLEAKINQFKKDSDKKAKELLTKVLGLLEQELWIKDAEWTDEEIHALNEYRFFTTKPIVYLINTSQMDLTDEEQKLYNEIESFVNSNGKGIIIPFSVKQEEIALEQGKEDISKINEIVNTGYDTLNLMHFYTAGPEAVRCWTIHKGYKAPQAGGVIHSDFEKGFICAEVMKYKDFISNGSESNMKNSGKIKQYGKDYIVQPGDILNFKFNRLKGGKKK